MRTDLGVSPVRVVATKRRIDARGLVLAELVPLGLSLLVEVEANDLIAL
jgi:hypothetical protein